MQAMGGSKQGRMKNDKLDRRKSKSFKSKRSETENSNESAKNAENIIFEETDSRSHSEDEKQLREELKAANKKIVEIEVKMKKKLDQVKE